MIAPESGLSEDFGAGRRILLVEDNPAAGRGLAKHLEANGFEVGVVSNGEEALRALRGGAPFDFVLTDLQLPDTDGLEVARAARATEHPPRVALITGWDVDERVAKAGIDWIFSKPIDIAALLARLAEAVAADPKPTEPGREESR